MYARALIFSSAILKPVETAGVKSQSPSAVTGLVEKTGVVEALVCAVTALAYVGTLSFGFVYDDKPVIVDSVVIRSWHFLAHYFIPQISGGTAPPSEGTFYRPITLLWLRLNYAAFGLDPAGWHFAMLVGHVLATYLVFVLVEKLTRDRSLAAIAGVLFGLHPVHVENVAWLSSVNDLLMTVLLLGSFIAYLNFREGKRRRLWLAASVCLFGLALLSKETAAVFPVLILAFAAMFAARNDPRYTQPVGSAGQSGWNAALTDSLVSLPYFAGLAIYLGARKLTLHSMVQPIALLSWKTMLLTAPSILWFDLKHLLLPISSSEFYSLRYVTSVGFENFLLPMLLLIVAVGAVCYWISKLRDYRLAAFALLWAFFTILPTLYLRAIAPDNFVHDRFLYLPSVGIVILAALAVEQLSGVGAAPKNIAMEWAVVGILCVAGFAGTVMHQRQWTNDLSLYENAIRYAPENPIVEVNLANELANTGRYDRALPLYESAVQRDPHLWLSNYNLGYAYYRTGRFSEAENYLKRAITIDDRDPDQFIYLAVVQMQQQKLTEAAQNAERALQLAPRSPGFHFVLAKIFEADGNRQQAMAEYQAEATSHPENAQALTELQRLKSSQ
jgi:Tfp pilus assembly protein PilF